LYNGMTTGDEIQVLSGHARFSMGQTKDHCKAGWLEAPAGVAALLCRWPGRTAVNLVFDAHKDRRNASSDSTASPRGARLSPSRNGDFAA
jgi:hypothetical protein